MVSEIYNSNDLPGDPNLHSVVGANVLEFTEPAALSPVLSFQRPLASRGINSTTIQMANKQ